MDRTAHWEPGDHFRSGNASLSETLPDQASYLKPLPRDGDCQYNVVAVLLRCHTTVALLS